MVMIRTILCAALALATPAAATAATVLASFYGAESGNKTANGETFRPMGMTAAHRTLPFGTRLRVCLGERCAVVRVNDRGPALWTGKGLDLAEGAAQAIGITRRMGVARVTVEVER